MWWLDQFFMFSEIVAMFMSLFLKGGMRKQAYWVHDAGWAHTMTLGQDASCPSKTEWLTTDVPAMLWPAKWMHGSQPHQNNPSAISEAGAWGISSFLLCSNALSSLVSPLILFGGLLEFDTQYSAQKKSELATQAGSPRICTEGEVGSRIPDWGSRCSVHSHFLEVWVFFLNVDRKRTSETKRKRSQASETSSNIFMPCWLEYMLNFFHQTPDYFRIRK